MNFIWKLLFSVLTITTSIVGRQVCGNKTCNICDCPTILVQESNCVKLEYQVNSTLCDFEIKYKAVFPKDKLFGIGFVDEDANMNGFPVDIVSCDSHGVTKIERYKSPSNPVPVRRLDIAEVECTLGPVDNVLEFDLYRPIKHLRDSNTKLNIVLMKEMTEIKPISQLIN